MIVAAVREELCGADGVALGVGMLAAGIATAELLARGAGALVLVGTAGAYPGGPAIGTVVTARRVGLGSAGATAGLGYVPLAPEPIELTAAAGLPAYDVLCLTAITTDPALAARLGGDWQIEHMEAFGVALACARAGVPLTVVLGVTNAVGPDAHAQWRANRARMQEAAVLAARVSAG
jgi:nucleoside phosphorylase